MQPSRDRRVGQDPGPAQERFSALFVCTGNICRSPMAEVVLRAWCDRARVSDLVEVGSAGTQGWHVGSPMDRRARAALDRAGYVGAAGTATHVSATSLEGVDLVVALDRGHLESLRELAPHGPEIETLLSWASPGGPVDVEDPYYGAETDFDACLELIVPACESLGADIVARMRRLLGT